MKKQFISFYDKTGDFIAIPVVLNPVFEISVKHLRVTIEINQELSDYYLDRDVVDSLVDQLSEA